MKFYHAANCNRRITSRKLEFLFQPYDRAGTWLGVYAATTTEESAALDELAGDPKSGVTVISQEEFDAIRKKKVTGFEISIASMITPEVKSQIGADVLAVASKSSGPVPAPEPEPPVPAPERPALERAEDAVRVGPVETATSKADRARTRRHSSKLV